MLWGFQETDSKAMLTIRAKEVEISRLLFSTIILDPTFPNLTVFVLRPSLQGKSPPLRVQSSSFLWICSLQNNPNDITMTSPGLFLKYWRKLLQPNKRYFHWQEQQPRENRCWNAPSKRFLKTHKSYRRKKKSFRSCVPVSHTSNRRPFPFSVGPIWRMKNNTAWDFASQPWNKFLAVPPSFSPPPSHELSWPGGLDADGYQRARPKTRPRHVVAWQGSKVTSVKYESKTSSFFTDM